jgi:hypothetical protein
MVDVSRLGPSVNRQVFGDERITVPGMDIGHKRKIKMDFIRPGNGVGFLDRRPEGAAKAAGDLALAVSGIRVRVILARTLR